MIHCQLEYESMNEIEDTNEKAAAQDASMARVLGALFASILDADPTSEMNRTMELLRRRMQGNLIASDNQDTSRQYTIDPIRKQSLQEIHAVSKERMKEWLRLGFELFGHASDFREWSRRSHASATFERVRMPEATSLVGINTTPPKMRQIILNGQPTEVGENLEKALRALREIPEVQSGARVWVDSLCINQQDLQEKSIEVMRMGDIYKKAERVISWLGNEQDRSGDVLEIMNALGEAIINEAEAAAVGKWLFSDLETELIYRIAQLLGRAYRTRIWIVQEIAMGSENSMIICGARRFPTTNILRFGKWLSMKTPDLIFNSNIPIGRDYDPQSIGIPVGTLVDGLRKILDLDDLRYNIGAMTAEPLLVNSLWFHTASSNNATDTRDLVYGMLNLLPSALASLIRVDYSAETTYRRVMVDFAVAHISSMESLYWILHHSWAPFVGHQDWPSWVPNLGLPFSSAHFHWTLEALNSGKRVQGEEEEWEDEEWDEEEQDGLEDDEWEEEESPEKGEE
ncbi:hypothetical protein H2199_001489 [Coniosporium tulheliwenetii]|uniref:Uncharacterized protein n=1 Tax=Coniosporium tulheliwenetii TaxID=3383036 RepID=A0ACC2ZM76_9PEZI|nr:hypothetical protein H2199_001489 [Cladosporium sp. JES 115]